MVCDATLLEQDDREAELQVRAPQKASWHLGGRDGGSGEGVDKLGILPDFLVDCGYISS